MFGKGVSSSGKTHNAIETSKYFPEFDVHLYADLTPKALYHMNGKILDGRGREVLPEDYPKEPKKKDFEDAETGKFEKAEKDYEEKSINFNIRMKDSYKLVDISHQIWIFIETPRMETLKTLRPLLSHDAKKIEFKYTDKTSKGQFKTSRVIITGYPATVFLSVDKQYIEELATRSFTTTPESSEAKILASNKITNRKFVFPDEILETTPEAKRIRLHILNIRTLLIAKGWKIIIPFDNLYDYFK